MPVISAVIPVFKAEGCLHELTRRLKQALLEISEDYEIIYVEDGGGDRSWDIIVEQAKDDPRIKGFQLSRNFGQHHAITAGLDVAAGDWTVVMDCDLQDRPEDIPGLLAKAREGFDVVIARRPTGHRSLAKRITSAIFYRAFSYLAGYTFDERIGSFRIFSKQVRKAACSLREQLRAFAPQMHWLGFKTTHVDTLRADRESGSSSYNWTKLIGLAIDTIVAFSEKPLRLSIRLGLLMSLGALGYGAYIFCRALFVGIPVPGWSSTIVSLYFIGGIIIINLGILGVYLGRTFSEVKGRPLYVISRSTVSDRQTDQAHGDVVSGAERASQ